MQTRIKHDLSFSVVPLLDPFVLVVQDTSVYRADPPTYPVLAITFPNGDKREVTFHPGESNVINYQTFGWKAQTIFPDGIYQLEYSVAPNDKVKVCEYYLKADQAQCDLIQWVSKIHWEGLDGCSIPHKTLNQLHALLWGAQSNARLGNLDRAKHQFALFQKLLCTTHLSI